MGINLNNPADVRSGINSLLQTKVNFKGVDIPLSGLAKIAKPFLNKLSPKIREATGFGVDELMGELVGAPTESGSYPAAKSKDNIHTKYKNL